MTGVQYHTGKNSCPKCTQEATYFDRRVVFSKEIAQLRTDESFKERRDLIHHAVQFHTHQNVLETMGFGMVSQFPLDAMHLVDLGVMKKILTAMSNNKILGYSVNTRQINNTLRLLSKFVPSEFGRTVRTLEDIVQWKATEYRHFLLYIGIVALKDSVHPNIYYNFVLLHSAIRLLSCKNSCQRNAGVAGQLLQEFVRGYSQLYGESQISFNLHCLLHLPECVVQFGTLDNFSAYKNENFMQYIKSLIRKPNKILQQIHRRLDEIKTAEFKNELSKFNSFDINYEKDKDAYCFVQGSVIKVIGFGKINNKDTVFGYSIKNIRNFFDLPVQSASALGILLCINEEGSELATYFKCDIQYKFYCIPYAGNHVLVPILHHCFSQFSH